MQISREPGYELIAAYLADIIKPVKNAIEAGKSVDLNEPIKTENEEVVESVKPKYVSFRDKYKPKTSWQLQELRNYGL